MKGRAILIIPALLLGCSHEPPLKPPPETPPTQSAEHPNTPQVPPVEFGRRKPNTPMTHDNMPFFDTVTYCVWATRGKDKAVKGPLYEACVEDQGHTKLILGQAIDAQKFKEADMVRCAKASRTAYQGMWYCLNGQDF